MNVQGTLNAFRAADAAGPAASSILVGGGLWIPPRQPGGMTEDWPVRPAARLFYAQEKAELEHLLRAEAAQSSGPALYLLRPSIVLGPHAVGAKDLLPGPLAPLARLASQAGRFPVPVPVLVPVLPLQFVHEEDVGQALLQCVVAAGPPGAYNIAGDGIVYHRRHCPRARPAPAALARGSRAACGPGLRGPALPTARRAWVEVASHPAIMDTTRAKQELGWTPRFTGLRRCGHPAARTAVRRRTIVGAARAGTAKRDGLSQDVSGLRSMTTTFPGPETIRLTSGVIQPHPVNGGLWYRPSQPAALLQIEAGPGTQRHHGLSGGTARTTAEQRAAGNTDGGDDRVYRNRREDSPFVVESADDRGLGGDLDVSLQQADTEHCAADSRLIEDEIPGEQAGVLIHAQRQ